MLTLSNLKPRVKKKAPKRKGRGLSSGQGTFGGRGSKGQKARTGGNIPPGFEGGRMPFIRQIPKVSGFRSPFPKAQIITLDELDRHFADGDFVTPRVLAVKGLLRFPKLPVKILGQGKLSKKLRFEGLKFSSSAEKAVEAAGGQIKNDK